MLLLHVVYEIISVPICFLFLRLFFFILNKTTSCKNKKFSSPEPDMTSKDFQNSDFIFLSCEPNDRCLEEYRQISSSVTIYRLVRTELKNIFFIEHLQWLLLQIMHPQAFTDKRCCNCINKWQFSPPRKVFKQQLIVPGKCDIS